MDANLVTSVCGYLLAFAVLYFAIALIHQCIPQKHSGKLLPKILGDPFGLSCALISLIVAANTFWGRNHNAEAARQLEKIVESTEFIGDVALPDSLEQTDEVRQLRLYQRNLLNYKIHIKAVRDVYSKILKRNKTATLKEYQAFVGNVLNLGILSSICGDDFGNILISDNNVIDENLEQSQYALFFIIYSYAEQVQDEFMKSAQKCEKELKNPQSNHKKIMHDFISHPNFENYLLCQIDLADAMNQIIKMRLVEISRASYENALKQNTNKK